MRRRGGPGGLALLLAVICAASLHAAAPTWAQAPPPPSSLSKQPQTGAVGSMAGDASHDALPDWLSAVAAGLTRVDSLASIGELDGARRVSLGLYLDYYERIEGYYGPGGDYAAPVLSERVTFGEDAFHRLLSASDAAVMKSSVADVRRTIEAIGTLATRAGVPLRPESPVLAQVGATATGAVRTPEVARILTEVDSAAAAYTRGDVAGALAGVERAYLEGFEPLESRLPAGLVGRVERIFHLTLRPEISRRASDADVQRGFSALRAELLSVDAAMNGGAPFWFGAFNSFAIVVREGLEAVLLIGAILAYLTAMDAPVRTRRQIFAGAAVGAAASLALWAVARTIVPIGGGHRELLEGVTALLAVGVLMYVSNWLFQKTYIHDWKDYLRKRVGVAATAGSALAMASLAFAAVFREGFETVLFYQALTFDAGPAAVLTGFLPGLLLILGVGIGIIRMGVKLPLRKVFGVTNAILLYLAFVFIGKGIYNLQEAGMFAPHPIAWLPDHPALEQLLGFHPMVETVAAQTAFLMLLGATYGWYRRRMAIVVGELGSRSHRRRSAA